MSKKILSIALAVVMLFSVMACTVGAANTTVTTTFPGANQVGFRVVTDAYVGQPAGEEVTVKVYWVHPVGTDYSSFLQSIGNVVLCYTDAFAFATEGATNDASGRTWGSAYEAYLKPAAVTNAGDTYSNSVINKLSTADQAYGWDRTVLVQLTVDTSVTTAAKGFALDPDCEIFSLSFTTNREVTADDTIGIPSHLVGSTVSASYSNGSKQTKWTAANIVTSEAIAAPVVVANSDTATAKMRPGTADGTVDLGITGTVNEVSFNPGKTPVYHGNGDLAGHKAANLANVGVQARVNGTVAAAEGTCVYATDDGFNYRAAIAGIDADGLGAQIEVRTYITDVNGNTYFSNWMFIDATTVHDNAVGNGMTGIA
ncbi:MAG: hypothetical protein E7530_08615 [Ruminococcaceae bacterium]|nr:hypothetical protein [Oscillospiraceae bacterium]